MSGAILGPRLAATARLALALWAPLFFSSAQASTVVDTNHAQCCSSVDPELPPATYYGATMYREEDPRSNWQFHLAIPMDPPGTIDEMRQTLDDAELENGAMGAGLVEPLTGLSAAYLAENRYREAVDSLRRGIHIARLNDGLHTPKQIALLEQLIATHVKRGDFAAADKQQAYLYRVKSWRGSHGSEEMLAATLRYADWMRSAYLGDLDRQRYPRLVGLNDLYDNALDDIEEQHGSESRALLPYLQGKVELSYLISVYPGESESGVRAEVRQPGDFDIAGEEQLRFWRLQNHNFRYGLQALRQREDIINADTGSSIKDRAEAHIAIADWYQWHRRYASAIRLYEEAWTIMEQADSDRRWLSSTFTNPLELPKDTIFNPGPMPLQTLNDAEVLIRFDVSRHGEAKDITILTSADQEAQPGITRAYHYLRNVRFRPRLQKGEVVRAENVERRYQIRY